MLKAACLAIGVICFIGIVSTPQASRASIVENDQSDATASFPFLPNISGSDLINSGSGALSSTAYAGTDSAGNTSFPGLADGAAQTASIANDAYFGRANSGYDTDPRVLVPRTATYVFDTVANPNGFDITGINTFEGFSGVPDYSDQRYTVYVSFVGTPLVFHLLDDVTYYPFYPFTPTPTGGPASSEVSLTDTSGTLASGVAAIEFSYPFTYDSTDPTHVGFEDGQLVQEIDVFGSPTPEPGSLSLLGVGATLALCRRKGTLG